MNRTLAAVRDWSMPRFPQLQAIVLFVVGGVILLSGLPVLFVLDGGAALPPSHPLRMATLVVMCAAVLLRAKAPATALGVGLVIAGAELVYGVSLATLIVLCDLLFAATLHGSRRIARMIMWMVGAVILGLAVTSMVLADDWRDALLAVLQLCAISLIPVWWGVNVRRQREVAAERRARENHEARIAELDRIAAAAEERSRMARDLHDVIAGHLSAIAIQSAAALSMAETDPVMMIKVLKAVRENSVASLSEMHAMIGLLRSEGARAERTTPARLRDIDRLLASARAAGLEVHLRAEGADGLPAAVDLSAYRIVQEALTNVVKHAPGSRAEITVGRSDSMLVVEVINEGVRAKGSAGAGRGLLNMRERAQAVGGVLVAGPSAGRRWRVRAELPVTTTEQV
ncbi:MAG TPA: histidine kinase [Actinophytocola sp.]|jgi:signal transduction histidine kinase|nr:histidine kinase [Actinophytocola sp.]